MIASNIKRDDLPMITRDDLATCAQCYRILAKQQCCTFCDSDGFGPVVIASGSFAEEIATVYGKVFSDESDLS